ncbi:MAG: VWA domain-containing protein [Planctomycetota bacterium]|nr:MAG: VWA domain-containing protein [Planctomycetota bacterium]
MSAGPYKRSAPDTGADARKPSTYRTPTPAQKGLYSLLGEKRLEYISKRHPRTRLLRTFFGIILGISIALHITVLSVLAIRLITAPPRPATSKRIIMKLNQEQKSEQIGLQTEKPDIDRAALERELAELLKNGAKDSKENEEMGAQKDDEHSGFYSELSKSMQKLPSEMDPSDFMPSPHRKDAESAENEKEHPQAADAEKEKPDPLEEKQIGEITPERPETMGFTGPKRRSENEEKLKPNPETDPRVKYENLPRPKSHSFTDWCRELSAPPSVHGIGGKGKPVVPNSGSPEFFGEPLGINGNSVIFVVDRSASMILESSKPFHDLDGALVRGTKLDRAKVELKRAVAALDEETSFNIIFFSQYNQKWKRTLTKATPVEKDAAFKFIGTIRHGEQTDTSGAVIEALMTGSNKHVILLSDGWPNILNGDASPGDRSKLHLARIRKCNVDEVRIDAFGFGVDEKGRRFLANAASENNGVYVEIEAMEEE